MRRNRILTTLLVSGLCLAASAASANGLPADAEIIGTTRTFLQDGIVHYTFDVDLGPDDFDTVRLHRIVKERRPHRPVTACIREKEVHVPEHSRHDHTGEHGQDQCSRLLRF